MRAQDLRYSFRSISSSLGSFFAILLLSMPVTVVHGQNIQHTQNVADLGVRSDLRVEPTSLGLNLQIPLRGYSGRGGTSLSASLFWSSKVWRISYVGDQEDPLPFGGVLHHAIVQGKYAEHSVSGWTTGLDLPWYEFTGGDQYYGDYGNAIPEPTEFPPNWQFYVHYVRRMLVHMPDGSSHELRSSDQVFNGTGTNSGVYLAVDGSRVKYDPNSGLYLPDGSRYLYPGQGIVQYIDRNGNALTYNSNAKQWTDTLGRTINMPPTNNSAAGDLTYSLPATGGGAMTCTFRWRNLADARTDSNQPLRYVGDYANHTPSLFVSVLNPDNVNALDYVDGPDIFNPVVLSEIVLPNGSSYKFTYNVWGEIDKIVYPTSGSERFRYDQVAALTQLEGVYAQGNRGVVERWISASGSGTDENRWQYSPSSTTAPDGTITTRSVYTSNVSAPYGFQDARVGLPYDERVYSPSGQMLRRNLTEYAVSGPLPGGYSVATRNPRATKEVQIILDTGGNALAKTTTYVYDQDLNRTSTNEYDFVSVDSTTAQTTTIGAIPTGALLRSTEATYLVNDPNIDVTTQAAYRARNMVTLPTSARVKDAAGNIVAQSAISYDEGGQYTLLSDYGSVTGWVDPATNVRGNVTSSGSWLNTANNYLQTHAQYDQCGNVRNVWDAKGNQSQVSYVDWFGDGVSRNTYAYPTTTTTAVPDPGGIYGLNVPLSTTTNYDFNTGAALSTTDANNVLSTLEYNDPLNRPTRAVRASGSGAQSQAPISYDDTNRVITGRSDLNSFNDSGLKAETLYDGIGRTSEARTYEGGTNYIAVQTQYDAMGRAFQVSNPFRPWKNETPVWSTSTFDALGRVISVTTPDGAVITTSYLGNTVTVTDQAGKKRRSVTDGLGRLTRVDEPDANGNLDVNGAPVQSTNYSYDSLDNLVAVNQGSQPPRTFVYDSLRRLTSATNPESGTISYQYDDNGNLTQKTDARGVVSTYAYDALNRNIGVSYANDPAGTPAVTRYYDSATNGKGRLYQTQTAGAKATKVTISSYDALGRPLSLTQQLKKSGPPFWGPLYTVQRTYDLAGHVLTQTYPSGHVVNYNFDLAGRLGDKVPGSQSATDLAFSGNLGDGVTRAYASAISYDEASRMQEEKYGTLTPLYHKQRFNQRGQLWDMRLSTVPFNTDPANGDRGAIVNYYSDNFVQGGTGTGNNGNLLRQEIFIPGSDYLQQNYSYDALNRLTAVAELKNGQTANFTQAYAFDRWGNRTIDQQGTTANAGINNMQCWIDQDTNRLYASTDQGISDPTQRLIRYDDAGNQTDDYYSPEWNGTRTYDAENRMLTAFNSSTNITSSYTYDGDGRRVRRIDPVAGEVWQVYGLDGELLAEYKASGPSILPQKEYGYRNGQLLITAANGDGLRLWNFMKNVAVRFGVYGSAIGDSQLLIAANALSTAGAQGQSQMLSAARTRVQNVIMWSTIPSDSDYVTALYLSYLQRFPDSNELNAWVSEIPTIGRDGVRDGFAYSNEFAARVSTLRGIASSDTERTGAFVQYMYNEILHRGASTAEETTAISSIDAASATGQATVVTAAKDLGRGLFNSAEYTSRPGLTPHDFVYDLYQAFYGSSPDASWDYWTDQVGANWENKQAVLDHFLNAGPYDQKAATLYREVLWLVPDQLGTPRMIAERTGALAGIKRHDYLPFGEELGAGQGGRTQAQGYSASDNVRQKFTQKERDNETGLDYFLARYYSSTQGRFTSPDEFKGGPEELFEDVDPHDPLFYADVAEPQSLNKYHYCLNNPLRYIDPDGHQTTTADRVKHAARTVVEFSGGVMQGAVSSATFGLLGAPSPNDSRTNRIGQVVGTVAEGVAGLVIAGPVSGVETLGSGGVSVLTGTTEATVAAGATMVAGSGVNLIRLATTPMLRSSTSDDRAGKDFTKKGKETVIEQNKGQNNGGTKCNNCGTETVPGQQGQKGVKKPPNERQVDHIKPKSRGGQGRPDNGQVLCRKCNQQKGNKEPQ